MHDPGELNFIPHEKRFLDRFGGGDDVRLKRHLLALAAFLRNKPQNTKRVYREGIRQFFTVFDWICPNDVTDRHAAAFKKWLKKRGLRDATVYHRLSTLASYFAYLTTNDLVDHNPFDRLPREDVKPLTENRVVTLDWPRFERVLNSMPSDASGLRDRAILLFFACTGCSRRAVANLRVRDLDVSADPPTYTVHASNGKRTAFALPRVCYDAIRAYWTAAARLRTMQPQSGVFVAIAATQMTIGRDRPLSIRMMNHILTGAARRAGVPIGRVRISGVRQLANHAQPPAKIEDVTAFLRQLGSRADVPRSPPSASALKRFGGAARMLVEQRERTLRF